MVKNIFFILFVMLLPLQGAHAKEKVLYEKNSVYQYIVVSEDTEKRQRRIHNNERHLTQGGMSIDNPDQLVFEYYRMSLISLAFLSNEPSDILVIGLGAGAVPKYLHKRYPDANIDIVEIDPEILNVARTYFNFKDDDKMRVFINDGRMFVKRAKKRYDIIFLDAYRNGSIPFHLTTREFLLETKKILKPGGVVTSNILSERMNQFHDSMVATYQDVFKQLYLFVGENSMNYIFVVTDHQEEMKKKEIAERSKAITKAKGLDFKLDAVAKSCICGSAVDSRVADVLTDDFAPVDILRHRKSKRS
ncbi:MAG: spermidine synthase [Nitrospirota bacterium]